MVAIFFWKEKRWGALLGYGLFIAMMAAGYYYNLTFVQIGLEDLASRLVGLDERAVAAVMGFFAVVTFVVALATGFWMNRRGWGKVFHYKLRLAALVVLVQTLLTAVVPWVDGAAELIVWVLAASSALGVGMPATFSMTVDLVPVRDRGFVAGLVTAVSYFAAAVFSSEWTIEAFRGQILWLMAGGSLGLVVLAFLPWAWVAELAGQHAKPGFGLGRFARRFARGQGWGRRRLLVLIILMFGVFFVDSLGFLRIIKTPLFMQATWQSPELWPRLVIGGMHALAALIGAVLYSALDERSLFLWIFGIFSLVHFMYTLQLRMAPGSTNNLLEAMLYAAAVSLYTVVNFAIWADLSTPEDISMNVSLGVAFSGWTATFLSTALSVQFQGLGIPLEQHIRIVDSLALLFFLLMLILALVPSRSGLSSRAGASRPQRRQEKSKL